MREFIKLSMVVLAMSCAVSCGLSLVLGHGWEQALGFLFFGVCFHNVRDHL